MKKWMLTAAVAAFVAGTAAASAADMTGTIKSIDAAKDTLTLANGQVLSLPSSAKIADFKVGEKVKVTYTKSGSKMDVSSVTPAA
jgi:Cu/Ag efflux protein CusF